MCCAPQIANLVNKTPTILYDSHKCSDIIGFRNQLSCLSGAPRCRTNHFFVGFQWSGVSGFAPCERYHDLLSLFEFLDNGDTWIAWWVVVWWLFSLQI